MRYLITSTTCCLATRPIVTRKEAALGFLGGFLVGLLVMVWAVVGRPLWTATTTHPGYGLRVAGRATLSEALRRACGRRWWAGR